MTLDKSIESNSKIFQQRIFIVLQCSKLKVILYGMEVYFVAMMYTWKVLLISDLFVPIRYAFPKLTVITNVEWKLCYDQ